MSTPLCPLVKLHGVSTHDDITNVFKIYKMFCSKEYHGLTHEILPGSTRVPFLNYHGLTHEILSGSTQENPFLKYHGPTHENLHGSTHEAFQMIMAQPM